MRLSSYSTISLPYTAADGWSTSSTSLTPRATWIFPTKSPWALAACEGVLLLVDASQGVEAGNVANLYLAMEHDLTIIPVINKIDLPAADVDGVKEQIEQELGLDPDRALFVLRQGGHWHRRGVRGHRRPDSAPQRECGPACSPP